jgi:hypothetical protein
LRQCGYHHKRGAPDRAQATPDNDDPQIGRRQHHLSRAVAGSENAPDGQGQQQPDKRRAQGREINLGKSRPIGKISMNRKGAGNDAETTRPRITRTVSVRILLIDTV